MGRRISNENMALLSTLIEQPLVREACPSRSHHPKTCVFARFVLLVWLSDWGLLTTIYNWRRQDAIDQGLEPGLTSSEKEELRAARRRITDGPTPSGTEPPAGGGDRH